MTPPTQSTCAAVVVTLGIVSTASVLAMESRVAELRAVGRTIQASIEIKDAFSEKYRSILEKGGRLHLRIEAQLWEDRPAWDRLVAPTLITAFRILRDPSTARIAVTDAGGSVSYPGYPQPLVVQVDLAPLDRIADEGKYYLHAVTTIGTIAERDIEDAGEAVFGRGESTISIGKVGKFLLHTVLQLTDYIQSTSARAKSRAFSGREIRTGVR